MYLTNSIFNSKSITLPCLTLRIIFTISKANTKSAAESRMKSIENDDASRFRDKIMPSYLNKKYAVKLRFNRKYCYLTSHGIAGSKGELCTADLRVSQRISFFSFSSKALVQFHPWRESRRLGFCLFAHSLVSLGSSIQPSNQSLTGIYRWYEWYISNGLDFASYKNSRKVWTEDQWLYGKRSISGNVGQRTTFSWPSFWWSKPYEQNKFSLCIILQFCNERWKHHWWHWQQR